MAIQESRIPFITCIRLVQGLIRADDIITPEETEFIERLMSDMGFTEEERLASAYPIALDDEEALSTLRSLSSPLRRSLLETLIKASRSDGHVDPREMDFVRQLAAAFGFGVEEIEELWETTGGRKAQKHKDEIKQKFEQLDLSRLRSNNDD